MARCCTRTRRRWSARWAGLVIASSCGRSSSDLLQKIFFSFRSFFPLGLFRAAFMSVAQETAQAWEHRCCSKNSVSAPGMNTPLTQESVVTVFLRAGGCGADLNASSHSSAPGQVAFGLWPWSFRDTSQLLTYSTQMSRRQFAAFGFRILRF